MSETPHIQDGEKKRESAQAAKLPVKERVLQSADLFQGRREVLMWHEGATCRLRLSKNDQRTLHN